MIYLDNAATSLQKPKEVEEEMIRALHTMGNPGRGAHDATLQAGRCVYQVREQLAQLFKAESADWHCIYIKCHRSFKYSDFRVVSKRRSCDYNSV